MASDWCWMRGTVRWVGRRISCITPTTWSGHFHLPRWDPRSFNGLVDELLWSVVTAFESVALVSMLCCFFMVCGCSI